jgi:hypothetical protein
MTEEPTLASSRAIGEMSTALTEVTAGNDETEGVVAQSTA